MPPKPSVRTWGTRFDTLPSSPPPSSPQNPEAALVEDNTTFNNNLNASNAKKVEKTPHDASVFVGSLPTNIEQSELSRLLAEHLSEHSEVKSIKLVKDSKGGVCAFVQCENAAAASSLIHSLQSSAPKHFLGRVLRYEPARAFRTLLISYRTPVQFIPSGDRKGGDETIQLDPPHAMRLWRPRNSKYLSILYNAEAVDAEHHANTARDPATEPALFLQPVNLDGGTIRLLCARFGPLESFGSLRALDAANDPEGNPTTKRVSYPLPHNGPRLPQMDPGCFEVKWAHRDDCVSALMTLRRVPHLMVTWAHQPPPYGFDQQGRFPSHHASNGPPYPFHVQNLLSPRNELRATSPSAAAPMLRRSASTDNSFSVSSANTDDWKRNTTGVPSQLFYDPASFHGSGPLDESSGVTGWSDTDFPPLGDSKADRRAEQGVWADKKSDTDGEADAEGREEPQASLSVAIAETNNHPEFNTAVHHEHGQELNIPDTPGLAMSPITPKTPGSLFPTTPTSANGDLQSSSFQGYESSKDPYFDDPKDIDPTTLFVGGLEMFGPDAWDEDKVSALFGRFGGLESVKVVKPINARAAFAFVKFDNTESPARAIYEEHNRVHGGRAMRVQLRDCNPPRSGNWRFNGRARGRFPYPHYGSQRRYPENAEQSHERTTSDFHHDEYGATDEMSRLSLADDNGGEERGNSAEPADFAGISGTEDHQRATHGNQTQSCPVSRRASPEPTSAPEAPPQPEYREWYDEPASATMTPPLPALNAAATVPGAPYPMPNGGYYPPPWAQPYPQQMPYGVPYYTGYPGYPMQGPPPPPSQPYSSPGGSDASGPASGPPRPWPAMGMYGAYIPYPAYPTRPPTVDKSSPRSQAPLQPTGFIQNEQGTLIPVYQPEALDQYMASNQATPTTTPPTQPPPPNGAATWQQYPTPPAYAFPNPMPSMSITSRGFPPQAQGMNGAGGWAPVPGQFPPPPAPHPGPPPNAPNHPTTFRGGYQDMGASGLTNPNGRRYSGRRDQHPNNNRNNPQAARPMPGRHPRGGMHHMGYALPGHGEGQMQMRQRQNLPRPPQFNSASMTSDRGQWTAAH
ncbi:hypothetical protein GGX14DRAFT_637859 [Mycena pura]|uniref:RRM domain-containing protein n=1 Tax=Mycena pura TaxID=153505 RepID=A0AAD7E2M2_9AGAR|nr:hypothetical protein GGX14DRAFT_637859 [Mycena pura]